MSRYIKYQGKLVKFADKLLKMAEHIYNEGAYYLRVLAGGGTVDNRGLVEDLYKLWEEQGRLDNIKVAILPQAGGVQRTSGIYRFFSKLFTLRTDANDVTQTTANSQPYVVNGAMVNPNGASRFMTHPTVSFGAGSAWSVTMIVDWNGSSRASEELFGESGQGAFRIKHNSDNRFYYLNKTITNSIQTPINNSILIGKKQHIAFTIDTSGVARYYINGILLFTSAANVNFSLLDIARVLAARDNPANSSFQGDMSLYTVNVGTLTPTQILEEYNLLRSYIPEIATTVIGTDEIATENCQMVATPMGRVIRLNNDSANVEKVTNGNFESGLIGVLDNTVGGGTVTYTLNTTSPISGTQDGRLQITSIGSSNSYPRLLIGVSVAGSTLYKLKFSYKVNNGICKITTVNFGNSPYSRQDELSGSGEYEFFGTSVLAWGSFSIYFDGRNVFDLQVDNISFEQIGWAGAKDLYNGLISQGSTVSNALLAAAMWRSPDSDHDKQAVFGKIYNGYAAQLLQMDIDAYNAANPSTPWGYHVATLQDFQAIKDTIGGVETAGKKIKINGTDYWTSDNGDNTSGVQALGSGYIDENGEYQDYKEATGFWTVTENGDMLEVVTLRDELNELFITE